MAETHKGLKHVTLRCLLPVKKRTPDRISTRYRESGTYILTPLTQHSGSLLSLWQRTKFFLKHLHDLRSESERIHHRESGLDIGYQLPLIFSI